MRRALVLAACAALVPTGAEAQSYIPRDGAVEQSMLNTLGANLQRRGYNATDAAWSATMARANARVTAINAAGSASPNTVAALADRTWQQFIKGLAQTLVWPLQLGKPGSKQVGSGSWSSGGGSFGGGGATGTWSADGTAAPVDDCGALKIEFDAAGLLLLPSYSLKPGQSIQFGKPMFGNGSSTTNAPRANSAEAAFKRFIHLYNIQNQGAEKKNWFGVIGTYISGANTCADFRVPAHRDINGVVIAVQNVSMCVLTTGTSLVQQANTAGHPFDEKDCPEGGQAGESDFHFYGAAPGWNGNHTHTCTWFIPEKSLGPEGYAINPQVSVAWTTGWPKGQPVGYQSCLLDASFIKRITDALYKDMSTQGGYDGVPYAPVQDQDVRQNGEKVGDLGDNPETGTRPTGPDSHVDDPAPTTPGGTTINNYTDVCDFGEGGCDDPHKAEPTLEDTHSNLMDPIFDWLPDLPSITMPTQDSQCPVWNVDLRSFFGGTNGQYLLNSHCTLMDDPDLSAALGSLMIALFGITAAMIVLRA